MFCYLCAFVSLLRTIFSLFPFSPFHLSPLFQKTNRYEVVGVTFPHMYMSYSDLFLVPNSRKHIDCYELYVTPNWAHNIKGAPL